MDGFQVLCTVLAAIVALSDLIGADHEYMVKSAESLTIPIDFETKLECIMNIEPDTFQWKFYPLPRKEASNPKAIINLTKDSFVNIPNSNFTVSRKQSDLNIKVDSEAVAGDYQCLAYYGASVVASVPWRITLGSLGEFPKQKSVEVAVVAGNTVCWRCDPPDANPEPYIDYYRNENYVRQSTPTLTKSLIIPNVSNSHSGKYSCRAYSLEDQTRVSSTTFNLKVVKTAPPQAPFFIVPPKQEYVVSKGDSVFFECSTAGNPIPKVEWKKQVGEIPNRRAELVPGGLIIRDVTASDDGTYICRHWNSQGEISILITLIYNEPPSIDCMLNTTDVKQGVDLDLDCIVNGTPEPQISWFLNGFSVNNDSAVEVIGNRIYFRPVEKRHAGNLQIFARNVVKTVYSSISLKVIPLSMSTDVGAIPPTRSHHRHNNNKGVGLRKSQKHTKMIPPNKPSISRLNDEAVVVRWSVPANKGLPIQFFKVQYRELGPISQNDAHGRGKGKWMTTNADIPPHIGSYEVNNLKPDFMYRFRIAAVYSNNDNKNSQTSDRFSLRRMDFDNRNPLPVPLVTQTETINSTAVKIYWKYDTIPNITVDGFFISYISASSAADYMKATVDGAETNSYILSHLQPDTVYDIKLQSFTSKTASEFSAIMKARTLAVATTLSPLVKDSTTLPSSTTESAGISKLYIIIAAAVVVGGSAIILAITLLLFCRKWKQKKNNSRDDRDKPAVEDHHIQADSNDYVVGPKTQNRANGVVPSNRITITANPLADADNKNQNMIEMSCLSSQNNNCSTTPVQPSASGEEPPGSSTRDKKNKNREKRIRGKNNLEPNVSGENYV